MLCSECAQDKSPDEFFLDRSRPRGRVARCKPCHSECQKADRLLPRRRFSEFKSNATRRGIAWNITFDEYLVWIWGAPCYFCSQPANGGMDRLNNEPFYSAQNAIACCARCNSMKGKDTLHDFLVRLSVIALNLGITANQAIACEGQ